MKIAISIFLMTSFYAHAGYQNCPAGWVDKNKTIYQALKRLEGLSKTGRCKLEVNLCDKNLPPSEDKLLGDVLVTIDSSSYYIPLYIDQMSASSSSALEQLDQWSLRYFFKDENLDSYAGEKEKDELEFYFNKKTGDLNLLEMRKKNRQVYSRFLFFKLSKGVTCER